MHNKSPKKAIKETRINEAVQREVSRVIREEVKDPRIPLMTSVTRAEVTGDLRYASVYISIYGDDAQKSEAMKALSKATPFIRSKVAGGLNLRYTPEIKFILDDAIEYGVNMISKINEIMKEENHEESNSESKEDNQPEQETQQVATNLATEIVTQNPINESHNVECNGVKIKNETEFEINDSILNTKLNINKNNIIIFHTHTCESYTPTEQYNYEQTGNYRTTDLNYSVARVGDELANYLIGYGFSVVHDKTYHDYPAYTGSYTRSKKTVEGILQSNPTDIIIDLHRDAIGSKSNYDPSVKIGDDVAAQLMFVIGTNGGGLYHPNWGSNLKFAIEFQAKANEMYPGLFKTMIVRNSRYNQNLGKAACIIEVGSTGNTLEQCINSMKYLSKVFEEYREQKRILITLTPIRTF